MFAEHYLWSSGGYLAERPWSLSFNRLFQSISETLIFRGKFDIYYKLKHRVVEIFTIQARHKLRLHDQAKHKTSAKPTFRWVLLAIGSTWSCLMLASEYYNRENYNKLESKLPWYVTCVFLATHALGIPNLFKFPTKTLDTCVTFV